MASVSVIEDVSNPENKTFHHDGILPPLPLPTLEQTIKKYLDSCKAVLSDHEFQQTKNICQKFVENEGIILQNLLEIRANDSKNWLDQWWLDKAYLETRAPLPLVNFSGPGTYLEHYWPIQEGTQLNRAAASLRIFMQFWQVVRKEKLATHIMKKKPLTMHQFRYLFNTCRIPHREKDELYHGFCTENEGRSPTHIIVLCQGYMFRIEGFDANTGKICTYSQFYKMLKHIRDVCNKKGKCGQGVPVLTSMDRDKWADARDHLIEISSSNKKVLEQIETSLEVIALGEASPSNYTEMSYEALCGDGNLCWYDKSYNAITNANGVAICNCDHTPFDAMVMIAFVEYNTQIIKENKGVWKDSDTTDNFALPVELVFNLDQQAVDIIADARFQLQHIRQNLELVQVVFEKFGKVDLKKYSVHPDFIVQLCIQLAYMQIHGKPAPTYETAMTRQFYHGRTETCRTCTPEAVTFCKAMLSHPLPGSEKHGQLLPLFQAAHSKFVSLMNECMMNQGCDRHLLGLMLTSVENGMGVPELFTDKAYTASGGNGNFIISSSFLGPFLGQGSVAPMTENGYGFFYRINNHRITYSLSAYNSCPDTSAQQMSDCFEYALASVFYVLKTYAPSKL